MNADPCGSEFGFREASQCGSGLGFAVTLMFYSSTFSNCVRGFIFMTFYCCLLDPDSDPRLVRMNVEPDPEHCY
jgi:hypothetical protein